MAELALLLPVFIASPSDVVEERNAAALAIRRLSETAAKQQLLLEPIRWEYDSRPGVGRPQALITSKLLERSELIIVIFGDRLGSAANVGSPETAAQEELRVGLELVRLGRADDVFLYFRNQTTAGGSDVSVSSFREQINSSKQILSWSFENANDLGMLVYHHVGNWLKTWERIPDVCCTMLCDVSPEPEALGENRLSLLAPRSSLDLDPLPFLGHVAVQNYQRFGPESAEHRLQLSASEMMAVKGWASEHPSPLVGEVNQGFTFSNIEWFRYFCARGLIDAIVRDDFSAVENVPYENAVHQLLAALAPPHARVLTKTLVSWLGGADGRTSSRPVVRNFAAYVLGMIGAIDAQDDLARAFKYDEGIDVRLYCTTSLAKLRCRRYLDLLVERYGREANLRLRRVLGQAICRIAGIAKFEL